MSSTMYNKVPKLRFPGFEGEWEENKVEELTINGFSNGVFNDPSKVGRGYRLINVKDMYLRDKINIDQLTRVEIGEMEFEKNKANKGDIFFTRSSLVKEGIAFSNILDDECDDVTFDGHLIRMRPDILKVEPKFLVKVLKTVRIRNQFISRGKTATMTTIGQNDLASVKALIPSLSEQQKIASFLSSVDSWIENLRAQKESLESYKKGVMQKIFSRELRFKDENGEEFPEWEEKRLGDLGKFISGQGFNDKEQGGESGIPFYKVSDMNLKGNETIMQFANHYVTEEQILRMKYKVIKEKAIIFAKVGAAIFLERKRIAQDFIVDNNMMAFIPNTSILFLWRIFERTRLSRFAQMGALPSYNSSDLKILRIKLPKSEIEQEKIADFLTSIDKYIDAKQNEIGRADKWKKGLMQNLFV